MLYQTDYGLCQSFLHELKMTASFVFHTYKNPRIMKFLVANIEIGSQFFLVANSENAIAGGANKKLLLLYITYFPKSTDHSNIYFFIYSIFNICSKKNSTSNGRDFILFDLFLLQCFENPNIIYNIYFHLFQFFDGKQKYFTKCINLTYFYYQNF